MFVNVLLYNAEIIISMHCTLRLLSNIIHRHAHTHTGTRTPAQAHAHTLTKPNTSVTFNLIVAVALPSACLGQPNSTQRWMEEHHRGHIRIVEARVCLTAKQPVRKATPLNENH